MSIEARRRFLRYLLASPLAAGAAGTLRALAQDAGEPITSLEQALNVFDLEAVARQKLSVAHWGYLSTGVDDDATVAANRAGYARFPLRVRRLVDIRAIDTSVRLFGAPWETPLALAPVSAQMAFHPDGELATARAARARGHLQILSTATSTGVEDVMAARGGGVWYQLYPTDAWPVTAALIRRVRDAGCPALVLTVDLNGGSNRETGTRAARADTRQCAACHESDPMNPLTRLPRKPMFRGIDLSAVTRLYPFDHTWESIPRYRALWPGTFILKGIVAGEDAELAVRHGVDGIIVSNHGGRAEESGRSTIESLAEVASAVGGRMPILLDGGIRRGTDIFKALALGASAVCIGRPYIWGLAAFGQPGVEAVLDILRRELTTAMRQAGTPRVSAITRASIAI